VEFGPSSFSIKRTAKFFKKIKKNYEIYLQRKLFCVIFKIEVDEFQNLIIVLAVIIFVFFISYLKLTCQTNICEFEPAVLG